MVELLDQVLEDSYYVGERVTGLQLRGKGMSDELSFRLLLIRLQSGIENHLKVRGLVRGGRIGVSLGHGSRAEGEKRLVCDREREHCGLTFYPTDDPSDEDRLGVV